MVFHNLYIVYHNLKITITDAIIVMIDEVRRLPLLPSGGAEVGLFSFVVVTAYSVDN